MPVTLGALRRARAAGLLTVCNTAPAPEGGLPDELLALCDVLCPNESEAALLTGAPTDTEPYPNLTPNLNPDPNPNPNPNPNPKPNPNPRTRHAHRQRR